MDPAGEWTATALFSPSKARAQQAQARDWAAVDAWLARKYPSRRPPEFERHEDTLQALLEVATLNESADERRAQVERLEKAALQSLTKAPIGIADEVLDPLLDRTLAFAKPLDILGETSVDLDCAIADAAAMGEAIVDLTAVDFDLQQQLSRAEAQMATLRAEQARIRSLLQELQSDDFQVPHDAVQNSAEWIKSTKQLKAKIAEYDERLGAARPLTASNGISLLQSKMEEVSQRRQDLANHEASLHAFQQLPPDHRAARGKVEEAREHLRALVERRDRLVESLVDSG